jgi:CHAT domain-containing protein/tetratricopeptide (TPR) repeat protein
MENSHAERVTYPCPACGQQLDADIWLIVDVSERPDLEERLRDGTIRDVRCSRCGTVSSHPTDVPILVYRPDEDPMLILSPADNNTDEEIQELGSELLRNLRYVLGERWRDEWVDDVVVSSRSILKIGLMREHAAKYVLPALRSLLDAVPGEEQRQIVEAHPELLSDEADLLLEEFVDNARRADQESTAEWLELHRGRLRRCREEGASRVFRGDAPEVKREEAFVLANIVGELGGPAAGDPARRVQLLRKALLVLSTAKDSEFRAYLQSELGQALIDSPDGSHADNVEQAIATLDGALKASSVNADSTELRTIHNKLGIAYVERRHGDRAQNVEQALEHYGLALRATGPEDDPSVRALIENNLGRAFTLRISGNRAENIEQAIEHFQRSLEVDTSQVDPSGRAMVLANLGNALIDRIAGDRADNLERAIESHEQAARKFAALGYDDHTAREQINLAGAYGQRINGDHAENLERAIAYCQQALEVLTPDRMPEDWAKATMSLANGLAERVQGSREDNLTEAVTAYEQALGHLSADETPIEWAQTHMNLGNAYRDLARLAHSEHAPLAVSHYGEALSLITRAGMPFDWALIQENLAHAYALGDHSGDGMQQAVTCLHQAAEVFTLEAFPDSRRRVLRSLGDLHFDRRDWMQAARAYSGAVEAGDVLLAQAHTELGRRAEVGETSRLHSRLAYCVLQMGEADAAFMRLEQGKTRLLREALALSGVDITLLPAESGQALQATRQTLRELEAEMRLPPGSPGRDDGQISSQLRTARAELQRLLASLRAAYPEFMPADIDVATILQLVPENGAILAPVVTSQGGAVFVLPAGLSSISEEQVVRLDEFDEQALHALLASRAFLLDPDDDESGWELIQQAMMGEGIRVRDVAQTVEEFTDRLWDLFVGPTYKRLQALGIAEEAPVTILLQGGIGLLPVHAASRTVNGVHRSFLDDHPIAYAPSAAALGACNRRLHKRRRHDKTLLAVIDPTLDLTYASLEGDLVSRCFAPTARHQLLGREAKQVMVEARAGTATYLHFACHGFYDWYDVMRSALLLADDDPLTLAEIISPQFDLNAARMVMLSACETGLAQIGRAADEYVGLPAGFLQAGAPAVIATLWAVNDFSTALLANTFYQRHVVQGERIGQALRAAQRWLRDLSRDEVLSLTTDATEKAQEWAAGDNAIFQRWARLEAYKEQLLEEYEPEGRPFAHPRHWAAFTASGAVW